MLPLRLQRTIDEFWSSAGDPGPYPRDIERAISTALPVFIQHVPRLTPGGVLKKLAQFGVPAGLPSVGDDGRKRRLHGCVVANGGWAFIFVNGTDPADEIRFTLAHEAAHLMLDYLVPRQQAKAHISPAAGAVLDGDRPATATERVAALITGVELESRFWLFSRDGAGRSFCSGVGEAERDADRVASELLAPEAEVLAALCDETRPAIADVRGNIAQLLQTRFGLPASASESYARQLAESSVASDGAQAWLSALNG